MEEKIVWPEWKTIRQIGRGSFGAVYEIERKLFEGDEETEKAAVKVIAIPQNDSDIQEMYNDGYDEESVTETFRGYLKNILAEYSLMRKMNGSSNIVNCDDVRYVRHGDGIGWDIYIKMELLTPLSQVLPAVVPEALTVKIAEDMCTALELCQKHKIIHRDIKPQNIFLSENGDYKLGDFGIAKTVEKTTDGTKAGTYKYMAPEVYGNRPYNCTADIYSLGLVLYWMLNERRMPFMPLPPEKLKAGMDEESRIRRFSGEKIPVPKNGSKELQRIVLKACAFNPKDRYQTAREMREDLARLSGDHVPDQKILNSSSDAQQEVDFSETTVGTDFDRRGISTVKTVGPALSAGDNTVLSKEEKTVGTNVIPMPEPEQTSEKKKRPRLVWAIAACVVAVVFLALFMLPKRNAAELPKDSNIGQIPEPEAVVQDVAGKYTHTLMADMLDWERIEDGVTGLYGDGTDSPVFGSEYQRQQIASVTFLASTEEAATDNWDVSQNQDGTVLAWVEQNGDLYNLYIGAEGGVLAPEDCTELFAGYANLHHFDFNNAFDTGNVTCMRSMFSCNYSLTKLDLSCFNTSNVTEEISYMFDYCYNLRDLDVSSFDTSNVTWMFGVFRGCSSLIELDVSNFDTSNVMAMDGMFEGCSSLTELDVSSFDTANVETMAVMFNNCNSLTELDVSSFDTANVTSMYAMFCNCSSLTALDVANFDTAKVTSMGFMFCGCSNLTELDASHFNVSKVVDCENFMDYGRTINGRPWEEFFGKQ